MHKTQAFQPFRALQSAWAILMKAPLPMWVGGLILVVVESLGSGGGGGTEFRFDEFEEIERFVWFLIPLIGLGLLLTLVVIAVTSWLKVGYYTGVESVMRDGSVEFEQLFKAQGRWLNVFLVHLFQLLLSLLLASPFLIGTFLMIGIGKGLGLEEGPMFLIVVLFCLAYLPVYIYFLLGLILMTYPAALDGDGPMVSLTKSWTLASGIRVQLFLMGLLQLAMVIVGICACCLPALAAGILGHVMWCEAYIQATRDDMGEWWVHSRKVSTPPTRRGQESGAAFEDERGDSHRDPEGVGRETAGHGETRPQEQELPDPDAPFDPSAWRRGPDIPPIEEDEPAG
jgi:hypothetical protein